MSLQRRHGRTSAPSRQRTPPVVRRTRNAAPPRRPRCARRPPSRHAASGLPAPRAAAHAHGRSWADEVRTPARGRTGDAAAGPRAAASPVQRSLLAHRQARRRPPRATGCARRCLLRRCVACAGSALVHTKKPAAGRRAPRNAHAAAREQRRCGAGRPTHGPARSHAAVRRCRAGAVFALHGGPQIGGDGRAHRH